MKQILLNSLRYRPLCLAAILAVCCPAMAGGAEEPVATVSTAAIAMFIGVVVMTLFITGWAARRIRSRTDYYAAGRGISGPQNGLAIAGDYMSAGGLLGMSGLVFLTGYDGLVFCVVSVMGMPVIQGPQSSLLPWLSRACRKLI